MSVSNFADLDRSAAAAWAKLPDSHRPEVLVGFDGFVDHIVDVVDKRTSPSTYSRIETIGALGSKISAAAGKSAGLGCVAKVTKLGGNGPIMANALCAQQADVVVVGILGEGALDPVFKPLASRARKVISLGAPAVTTALEFDDGKVMLNFSDPMNVVCWDGLLAKAGGLAGVKDLFRTAQGIASVNWTQAQGMTDLWRHIADEVLPGLRSDRPRWFVDLSDPHRRPDDDIREGMTALVALQSQVDVVLGLNENECRQMCGIYGLAYPNSGCEWEAAEGACTLLQKRLGLSLVMCHLVRSSACAWADGSASADGFFCPKPKITTGAGDHYNAGFFGALLAGLAPAQCLQIGAATSGHYVRTGESPTRAQVCAFLGEQIAASKA